MLQEPEVGCAVTTLASGELYSALERGILDATELGTPSTDISFGFQEICDYYMFPGIHQPSTNNMEWVNADSWAALPDDLKAIYIESMYASMRRNYADGIRKDIEAIAFFQQVPGLTIMVLPDKTQQQFFEIADKVYKRKSAEDPFFAEVYQSQLDFMEQYKAFETLAIPKF